MQSTLPNVKQSPPGPTTLDCDIPTPQSDNEAVTDGRHVCKLGQNFDLERSISEVQSALDTLPNCYGNSVAQQPDALEIHLSSGDAGSSIIGMLEVIEKSYL